MTSAQLTALFKKYMKVKDPNKAHAPLSASGSERWLGCPASVSLSKGLVSADNEWGIAGTNAHTLLQFILENLRWEWLLSHAEAREFKRHIGFSFDQLRAVRVAVDYIQWQRNQMHRKTGIRPELHIEQKVHLKGVGFGTSDVMLYQPFGLLHVMDFKNGKYKVSPENNTQGLYYGVGAADKFGWDFREIWISIIQPNAPGKDGAVKTWKTTPKRLEEANLMFLRGAARTRMKNPPVIPSHKYCYFCPAREKNCPAHAKKRQEKIVSRFEREV